MLIVHCRQTPLTNANLLLELTSHFSLKFLITNLVSSYNIHTYIHVIIFLLSMYYFLKVAYVNFQEKGIAEDGGNTDIGRHDGGALVRSPKIPNSVHHLILDLKVVS